MGHGTVHWDSFGRIPPRGGPQTDREGNLKRTVRRMVISPNGGRDGRGVTAGGGDLSVPPPEHSHTVYCNQYHYGPVTGGREEARVEGGQAVVGSGWAGFGRDENSGLGGKMDVGGG